MFSEMTGWWEELVNREEFRGHQVRIVILDQPEPKPEPDEWLESLRQMAGGGVRISRPADDSRESIYEGI
jgi:hypothetical protein